MVLKKRIIQYDKMIHFHDQICIEMLLHMKPLFYLMNDKRIDQETMITSNILYIHANIRMDNDIPKKTILSAL